MGGSVLRKRRLGNILRDLRLRAGMTISEAAPKLDFSAAKLSRIENASQGVDVHVVRSMMDLFGVVGNQWEELLELTRETNVKGWWRAYGLDDQGYIPLESEATAVREYTGAFVPGLLQTPDYAQALFEASLLPRSAKSLQRDIKVRMIRQERLTSFDDPLELIAVVEEAVLRRPLGGRAVMRTQLSRLIEAAELDTVTVQILPTRVADHPAYGGAFTVLTFDGLDEPDMGYIEHFMGSVHVEKEEVVAGAKVAFDRLRAVALSPAESTAFIGQVAAQM